jgi:NAD(P)-dependent dehydrogenase (short-subunit alcohol dehydrogenase family)
VEEKMDLKDKVVVVSGGTSGIGRATALMLAGQGADVTVIGRDPIRGAATEAALKSASGGKGSFVKADLSLLGDVNRVVEQLKSRLEKLDALVQSAGGVEFEASTTAEGLNKLFVMNFLHRVALAEGLKPLLAKAQGRMAWVAADLSDKQEPDWKNFEGQRIYAGVPALPRLHTAGLAMVQYFAAAWKSEGIEVTAIHPGIVETGFFRSVTGFWKLIPMLFKPFFISAEKPAALLSWLAFAPEAKGLSGYFFPSVKDYTKRRLLNRSQDCVDRVQRVTKKTLIKQA